MSQRSRDVRNVVVGLLTGGVVTLAMGQAAAPDRQQPQAAHRYQIGGAMRDNLGNEYLFILDHQTQRVHRARVADIGDGAPTVEKLIRR